MSTDQPGDLAVRPDDGPSGPVAGQPIRTFVTLTGQRDNVGDSLLRRLFLQGLQPGGPCAVYVGGGRASYVSNLGVRPEDRVYTELRPWLAALIRSVATSRTNLVLNTGEITFDRRYSLRNLQTLPLALAVKLRGGAFIQAGLGVRDVRSRVPAGSRLLAEIADVTSWRDEPSRAMAGTGQVQPDWAFAEGSSIEELSARADDEVDGAPTIVLSLRRDGWLPTKAWLQGMAEACRAAGARPVVVCQVRRDATRCRSLASELGAELVEWEPDVDHREQEQRLREVYRRSTWVVSNRLHVLIAAVTEGAVILPYVPDEHGKLARSLATAGIDYEHVQPSAATAPDVADLPAERRELVAHLVRARAEVSRPGGTDAPGARRARARPHPGAPLHGPPTADTRYRSQMAATAGDSLEVEFFSWPIGPARALRRLPPALARAPRQLRQGLAGSSSRWRWPPPWTWRLRQVTDRRGPDAAQPPPARPADRGRPPCQRPSRPPRRARHQPRRGAPAGPADALRAHPARRLPRALRRARPRRRRARSDRALRPPEGLQGDRPAPRRVRRDRRPVVVAPVRRASR